MRKLAVALLIGCLLPCPADADEGTPREKPGGEPAKTTPRRRPRPSVWSEMGLYFKNRGEDFLDIWRFQGGLGLGLHADVEATDLLHASVGASRMNYRGPVGREMLHVRETQLGIPVANYFAANTRLVTADEGRGVLHE
ncbi:MAG: hypothetical protein FJ279_31915, partial [Planctomycetes bacterium]|nr:hypothetical protein [Planctomycetota bacterium]